MGFADMARKVLKEIEEAKDSSPCQGIQAEPGPGSPERPYLDSEGDLVIPFGSDPKYHWWAGGQSVEETMKEITEGKEHA